ncbi:MAG: 50S ribosomal protein L10, partial [Gemmatimonadales bacterium]
FGRRGPAQVDGAYYVTKNTLLRYALEQTGRTIPDDLLVGQLASGFALNETPALAKVLTDFAEDAEQFTVKFGIMGDLILTAEQVDALAKLPALLSDSRESAVGLLAAMIDQHICLGIAIEGGAGMLGSALSEAGKPYLKWKARIYAQQARAWEAEQLERALRLMRDADWRSKSGVGDRATLEELLLSLRLEAGRAA